jgi:hypothetical protein
MEFFQPDPLNIMSYGDVWCFEYFSDGQGDRMRAIVLDDDDLLACKTQENVTFSILTNNIVIDGWDVYSAHNAIVIQGLNYEIAAAAGGFFGAPSTTVLPKVHFAPLSEYVLITPANNLCD